MTSTQVQQEPIRIMLRRILTGGMRMQMRLIETGKSKRDDCKEVYDRAATLYHNAYIITDSDAIAKEYVLRNRDYIAKALLPSNLKKFNKIIDLITKNER